MGMKSESSVWGSLKRIVRPNGKKRNDLRGSSSSRVDSTPLSTPAICPDVDAAKGEAKSALTSSEHLSNAHENNATSLYPQPGASEVPTEEAGAITAESLLKRSPEDIENTGEGIWYRRDCANDD